jgi:hypothetical protein
MPRDRALERDFLESAACDVEFAPRVALRLEAGEAEYGEDGFRARSLAELLDEIGQEGQDIAGWACLAVQVVHHQVPDVLIATRLVGGLLELAEYGARADLLARTLAAYTA